MPFSGRTDMNLLPGETVIVTLATGRFGESAVTVALAMGTSVVSSGRNEQMLVGFRETFDTSRGLRTVVLIGDRNFDTQAMVSAAGNGGKGADAYRCIHRLFP